MKAAELRIGNYAQDENGNLLKVIELTEVNVVYSVLDRSKFPLPSGWKAEPIPLTEEWLLKFGYEWEEDDGGNKYYSIQIGNTLSLTYEILNKDCGIALQWRGSGAYIWHRIEYVHQLQNLYFELTGEELTIKL